MVVYPRYAISALAILLGVMSAFFVWEAAEVREGFEELRAPVTIERVTLRSSSTRGGSTESEAEACPAVPVGAQDPVSNVCQTFGTLCDVPHGWIVTDCSSTVHQTSTPKIPPRKRGDPPPALVP